MERLPVPLRRQIPLAPLTSWKIGGPAAYFAEPETPDDLAACLRFARGGGLPVLALGGGSNILVADAGYPGLVLRVGDRSVQFVPGPDGMRVRLGSRASLAATARRLAHDGWVGLEWAEGIPGTIGGAVVGNAGAYGGEISDILREVEVFSLERGAEILTATDCSFGYRRSCFRGQDPTRTFVLGAVFTVSRGDPQVLEARIRQIAAQRKARTPVGLSCGSVFKNPPGDSAGRLIEAAGLKGLGAGGARISERHGNYIVNEGGATAGDVWTLIGRIHREVEGRFGIALELEVQPIGFPPGSP